MRVLLPLAILILPAAIPVAVQAEPVELSGRFLIERDAVAALPGAPSAADAVPGGTIAGTWVVDARDLTREALTGGIAPEPVPFASGFTVSSGGQALYGEVMSHSRVTGQDAPADGTAGDRVVVDAFAPGAAGDLDAMQLVLTGPADWFETTPPGALPDLSRATVAFEGRMLRGGQVVQERSGRAMDPISLRRIAPDLGIAAPGLLAAPDQMIGA
jgi:hypothetical protein